MTTRDEYLQDLYREANAGDQDALDMYVQGMILTGRGEEIPIGMFSRANMGRNYGREAIAALGDLFNQTPVLQRAVLQQLTDLAFTGADQIVVSAEEEWAQTSTPFSGPDAMSPDQRMAFVALARAWLGILLAGELLETRGSQEDTQEAVLNYQQYMVPRYPTNHEIELLIAAMHG